MEAAANYGLRKAFPLQQYGDTAAGFQGNSLVITSQEPQALPDR